MQDPNVSLAEQTGGWFNVAIFTLDEITNWPNFLTNQNASSIIVTPNNNGLDILPIRENISISEDPAKTTAGTIYTIKADFEFPYQSAAIDTYLNEFINKKVVLIGVKHSGQQKLYGSKKFPLQFEYQHINGTLYEDGNKTRVTVTGKIPQKPVFIND